MGQAAGCEKSSQSLRHRTELATQVRYSGKRGLHRCDLNPSCRPPRREIQGTIFSSSARGGSVAWIGMAEGTTPMLNAQASRPAPSRQYSPRRVHHIDCMTQYGSTLRFNPSCSSPREYRKEEIPLAAQWRKPSA